MFMLHFVKSMLLLTLHTCIHPLYSVQHAKDPLLSVNLLAFDSLLLILERCVNPCKRNDRRLAHRMHDKIDYCHRQVGYAVSKSMCHCSANCGFIYLCSHQFSLPRMFITAEPYPPSQGTCSLYTVSVRHSLDFI